MWSDKERRIRSRQGLTGIRFSQRYSLGCRRCEQLFQVTEQLGRIFWTLECDFPAFTGQAHRQDLRTAADDPVDVRNRGSRR